MSSKKANPAANINFFKEARAELSKVTWPTRPEAIRLTTIVIITAVIAGVVMSAFDSVLVQGLKFLLP